MIRSVGLSLALLLSSCQGDIGLLDVVPAPMRDGGPAANLANSTTPISTGDQPRDGGPSPGGGPGGAGGAIDAGAPNPTTPILPAIDDGWGVPVNGFPDWHERTILVLSNGVRVGPQEWKTAYMSRYSTAGVLSETVYPPVTPLTWNLALNQVARQHSNDMSKADCGFSHICYGKTHLDRIAAAYGSPYGGENIAKGRFNSPLEVVNTWVCEGASLCLPDGQGDGHRSALMARGFRELGVGHFRSSRSEQFYTQDFGLGLPVPEHLLVAGSHLPLQGQVRFFANVYDSRGNKPLSIKVVLGSTSVALSLQLGSDSNGLYTVDVPVPSSCESYHFEAVGSSGQAWRYPSRGRFQLYGSSGCASDYSP